MLLFLSLSLLLCGVIATPIATINNNQRIVGGDDAYEGQFPYQVSIRVARIGLHVCGGSIISNEWILTAAICVADDMAEFRVVMGSIYLNSGGVTHKILHGVQHPEHGEEQYYLVNDIGLIRTEDPIIFSDLIQPIKLSSQPSLIGLPLTVAGWGWKDINNPGKSNILKYVTLNTISLPDCEKYFYKIHFIDTQICTHSVTGKAICLYDAGNPLVYNGKQYAIASAPVICGLGFPDVHTGVESYLSWIKEISNV